MAGSRHYWWEGLTSRLNPAKWAKGFRKRLTPKPERRRGSREDRPAPPAPGPGGGPRPIRDPYRDAWGEAGGQGSFARQRAFFFALPVQYESRQDELDTWRSFVENMGPNSPYRYKDPGNPFWSEVGLHPNSRGFNWNEWRTAVWGGRHRTL